jgi:uncharacterized surface protein with fasciclin (FAS1) repeats
MNKKLFTKTGTLFLLVIVCLLLLWACNKSNSSNNNPPVSTLESVLATGTTTTIFHSAVLKAGLDTTFNSASIFTLLVPNDQACIQSGFTQTVINGFTRDQARQWVLYQTYAGTALNFESFIGKTEEKLIMANGDSVFISGDSNRTFVNGYQFLNSELTASNGMMLALQNVLLPPQQNLVQLLNADTSLTFFNEAILLAAATPDSLSTILSTGAPFSLIAPVNDAFRILGFNAPTDLSTVNPDSLRSLVLLSMIPRRLFSYDILDSTTLTTAGDSTLLFTITGIQATVQIQGSSNKSNIISSNAMAINGVLFKMDSLLVR